MGLKLGYEIKNLIPIAFCERCGKNTRHKYSYLRKTKRRPHRLVYYGCSCGVSLILIGYLDENKNIIYFKNQEDKNIFLRRQTIKR